MMEVLTSMPAVAERNDDFLFGQFGAQPLDRSSVTPVDDAEFARCEAVWKQHWSDVEELQKDSQKKRSTFFLNEMTAYTLYRIRFALPLSGYVSWKIHELAGTFDDCQEDALQREAALSRAIKEVRAVTPEVLRHSLGHATCDCAAYGGHRRRDRHVPLQVRRDD